jgi:hypothetical protein
VAVWLLMALASVGAVLITGAGLTVMVKLVLTVRLPGSVAVTVMLLTPLSDGVPERIVPIRLKPAGSPLIERLRLLGVCSSVKVLARLML